MVVTADRRGAAADLASRWGVEADALLDSPYVLPGTHTDMAEALRERAERFGITYHVVFEHDADALAPALQRLA